MLTPGKEIPFNPPHDGLQPTLRLACCRSPKLSRKSPSRSICLSSEAVHG
jgi:hypothetical protein